MSRPVGRLHNPRTDQGRCLRAQHVVGRAQTSDLRLDDPAVSNFHAALQWTPHGWMVRDLGSTNGVFVNGDRIEVPTLLREGDELGFGGPSEPWRLTDGSGPVAFAVSEADGREIEGTAATLGLPDAAADHTSISRTPTGWFAERGEDVTGIVDREVIEAEGRWRLHLPHASSQVTEATAQVCLQESRLHIVASRDLEHIEVHVHHPSGLRVLPHYAANEVLLVLALARRDDPVRDPVETGWVDFDDLLGRLQLTPGAPRSRNRARQWIHKCRRRLEELGVTDGERIVERRAGTREVRLGTHRFELERR